jgi:hypothetical protein
MNTRNVFLIGLFLLISLVPATLKADPNVENTINYIRELQRTENRFTKNMQGIITDRKTGFQWYCGYFFNRKDWHQIKLWAEKLTIGGGGWRLATMDELAGLHPAAAQSGLFGVDWTYSDVITTSSPAADSSQDPHFSEYTISSRWWQKKGKIPSHYGKSQVCGSLSFIDGTAYPNLCGKPGTGRVRVSIAVRRARSN